MIIWFLCTELCFFGSRR